ncbi:hypothetical protein M9458_019059, partial [Cirrhinus mrigala]
SARLHRRVRQLRLHRFSSETGDTRAHRVQTHRCVSLQEQPALGSKHPALQERQTLQ